MTALIPLIAIGVFALVIYLTLELVRPRRPDAWQKRSSRQMGLS